MEVPLIKKKVGGIYGIRNIISGKIYIGSSRNIRGRFFAHVNDLRKGQHANDYLQHSFFKYKEGSFEFIILELVEKEENLLKRENFYINFYQSYQPENGYNLIKDAEKRTFSLRSRKKMSESAKGKIISEETRKKLSLINKGKKWSEEERRKNEEYWTKERRNEFRERFKGKKPSQLCIQRSIEKTRGRKWSEEERKKHEGRKCLEETKRKISEKKKGKKLTLEQLERRKQLIPRGKNHHHYGKSLSQEVKDKIAKTKKAKNLSINGKPVIKMSLEGKVLERFESVVDAQKNFGSGKRIYKACCNGKPEYGFLWIYASSPLKKNVLSQESRDRISAASKLSKKATRPIVQVSESGKILKRFESATEATKIFNCKYKIKDALRNKKPALGFYWMYASTPFFIA